MAFCVKCGHELGVGRFCLNCGHAVGEPVVAEAAPAPVTPTVDATLIDPAFSTPVPLPERADDSAQQVITPVTSGIPVRLLAVIALVVVLVVVVAVWAFGGGDEEPTPADPTRSEPSSAAPSDTTEEFASVADARAQNRGKKSGEELLPNLLDGDPGTAWTVKGDASGQIIKIKFDQPVEISRVGLINGLLADEPYAEARRVTAVSWKFDDGSKFEQDLLDTTAMQILDVPPVLTQSIKLRIMAVSDPGVSRSNLTAITDLTLLGRLL